MGFRGPYFGRRVACYHPTAFLFFGVFLPDAIRVDDRDTIAANTHGSFLAQERFAVISARQHVITDVGVNVSSRTICAG